MDSFHDLSSVYQVKHHWLRLYLFMTAKESQAKIYNTYDPLSVSEYGNNQTYVAK